MNLVKPELHIYLRVSSEAQEEEGFGLITQEKSGRNCAIKHKFKPVIHKEGAASSFNENFENRPVLKRLLALCEGGGVKNLYAYNLDRLSRNDLTSSQIRYVLKKNSVNLFTHQGIHILDNPQDNFMIQIMSAVGTLDNEVRVERLRRGKLEKIKSGGWQGGAPPFGYKNENGYLIEEPTESKWVKKMYEWFDAGIKIDDIRLKLMIQGVLTRRGRTNWGYQTILNILSSSIVDGRSTYTDKKIGESVEVITPRLVDAILSQSVKDKVSQMKVGKVNIKHNSLFKEVMRCGGCGSTYGHRFNSKDGNSSYYCLGNEIRHREIHKGSPKVCEAMDGSRNRSVNMPKADGILWNGIIEVISNSSLYKEFMKQGVMGGVEQPKLDEKSYKREIKRIDGDIKKLKSQTIDSSIQSLLSSEINLKEVMERINSTILQLESDKKKLIKAMRDQNQQRVWVDWVGTFNTHIEDLKTSSMSLVEKKRFVSGLVDEITVITVDTQTQQFAVKFKLPFVGSKFRYLDKDNKSKGYEFVDGDMLKSLFLKKT